MENLYAVIDKESHKCKILNLVYTEACSSYCIYNIYKNNVESARRFSTVDDFERFLEERKKFGIISDYYSIEI